MIALCILQTFTQTLWVQSFPRGSSRASVTLITRESWGSCGQTNKSVKSIGQDLILFIDPCDFYIL